MKKKQTDTKNANVPEFHESTEVQAIRDEYQALHEIKYGVSFHGIIRSICARPFQLCYCLPEQEHLCKELIKLTNEPLVLLVLNNLICNVTIKSYTSNDVFLMLFAMKVGSKTINLVQALSEKMQPYFIINFCHLYLKSLIPPTATLVVGYSKILLNSTSKSSIQSVLFSRS